MTARLLAFFAERPAREWTLGPGRSYRLGRDEGCDLALDDDRVSRHHALIEEVPGGSGWSIRDLGSKNGTAVEGRKMAAETLPLPDSAWISFGGVPARFEVLSQERRERLERTRHRRRATTNALALRLDPARGREDLLDRTLESLVELVDAERAAVLLGPDAEHAEPRRSFPGADATPAAFTGSRGAVARVYESGRALVAADALAAAPLAERGSILAGGIRTLACLPLSRSGVCFGVLYADSRKVGVAYTELDLELLEALATHASLALAAERVDEEIRRLAREEEILSPRPPRPLPGPR